MSSHQLAIFRYAFKVPRSVHFLPLLEFLPLFPFPFLGFFFAGFGRSSSLERSIASDTSVRLIIRTSFSTVYAASSGSVFYASSAEPISASASWTAPRPSMARYPVLASLYPDFRFSFRTSRLSESGMCSRESFRELRWLQVSSFRLYFRIMNF